MPPAPSASPGPEREPPGFVPRRIGRAGLLALLERHGIRPSRALGQNFLVDPNVAERIVRLSGAGPGDHVVEIGAGAGSLTLALARSGARVVAVELDRRLLPALAEVVAGTGVEVVAADAMSLDWQHLLGASPWSLVANLPYNLATPLVLGLLAGAEQIGRMTVMVQREVAERLAAPPGSEGYGAASARLAYFARARVVMRVPPSVFVPRPKVESAVVEIIRREAPAVDPAAASYAEIDSLLRAAFGTRRKMLRRSLGGAVTDDVFTAAGIDSARRPETLGIEEWGRLAAAVRRGHPPGGRVER